MSYRSIVSAYDAAVSNEQQWRQATCDVASKFPNQIGKYFGDSNSFYTHHVSDSERRGYSLLDEMIHFDGRYKNFGLGIRIEKDRIRRISIKLRSDFRQGRLFIGIADEDDEEKDFFLYPDSCDQLYDRILNRILKHLKTDKKITAETDRILIGY